MAYLDDPFGFAYMENKNTMAYLDDSSFGNAYMDNKPAYHADLPDNAHVDKKEISDTNASYSYNKDAAYSAGAKWGIKNSGTILTTPRIYINSTDSNAFFDSQYQNIFDKYKLTRVDDDVIKDNWETNPMQFWQNQLNFAVWCSTSGCGVAYDDHIMTQDKFMQSLYRFHVYYTIRRILKQMQVPLPQGTGAWDAFDNPYDRTAYEEICDDFGVSPNTNWRLPGDNNGLGSPPKPFTYAGIRYEYLSNPKPFTNTGHAFLGDHPDANTKSRHYVTFIEQTGEYDYSNFIVKKGNGFTQA